VSHLNPRFGAAREVSRGSGSPARWRVLLGLALLVVLVPASSAVANADGGEGTAPGRDGVLTTTQETDCYEVGINRSANLTLARQLVPKRYILFQPSATTARLRFVDYHCESLSVDGHPPARDTTVSIIGYVTSTRDGVAGPGDMYIIAIATDNPVLFAKYRAAGLPVEFNRRTSASETSGTGSSARIFNWNFVGDGLDHTIRAETTEAPAGPITSSTGTFYFDDERRGDLRLRFDNLFRPDTTARIFADFRDASAVDELFSEPRFLIINGANFTFTRGSWTGVLERLD
jgi:hypothetical protein